MMGRKPRLVAAVLLGGGIVGSGVVGGDELDLGRRAGSANTSNHGSEMGKGVQDLEVHLWQVHVVGQVVWAWGGCKTY